MSTAEMSNALPGALSGDLLLPGIPTRLPNPSSMVRLMPSRRAQAHRCRRAGIEEGVPNTRAMVGLMGSGRTQAQRCWSAGLEEVERKPVGQSGTVKIETRTAVQQ